MEERIIDDEYGRGVRLKKTKDGYVDVTDETLETGEVEDEALFEFPQFDADEDDEELAGLTPEQAAELIKRREDEAAAKKAEYERRIAEGEELLKTGSFRAAELQFEKALALDDVATAASVGYWRAKTSDFTDPDVLISEYADAGIESLDYDLGEQASEQIKKEYKPSFERRVQELTAEEEPLASSVEGKQKSRRAVLKERIKKATVAFFASALPAAALLVLAIVFGLKNFTTRENTFVLPTVLLGVGFVLAFIVFIVFANRLINALRMNAANEKLSSTEEGARLEQIRKYKALYLALLGKPTDEE
jgi:Na+-transporting methylmalonyl-CoA/oxaloacetate decarboxylase gamma subunit